MKNNHIFQNKNFHEKRGFVLHFFFHLINVTFTEDSWILTSASAFDLLQYPISPGNWENESDEGKDILILL